MANGKSILVDTTRCTACRGCQVSCKQWNELPAENTRQTGSYQNPPDFSPVTYKVVRFSEGLKEDKKPFWYFFSDQCRHCIEPGCMAANEQDQIVIDKTTGAVLHTEKTATIDFELARNSCPYDVPRQDPKTKAFRKCTMCFDRITNGRQPACVQSCPTGAMVFGERDEILKEAEKRVAAYKAKWPKAQVLEPNNVRVMFLVMDDPMKYSKTATS